MHCYDSDFSVVAVLPLYNVVHAQVILKGATPDLTNTKVNVTYQAIADATGSINTHQRRQDQLLDLCLAALWRLPGRGHGPEGAKDAGGGQYPAALRQRL